MAPADRPDRAQLLDAYSHAGQELATVYLPSRSTVADAEHRLEIRIGNAVSELGDQGASAEAVEVVRTALEEHDHAEGEALVLVASPEGVVLRFPTIRPVTRSVTAVARTPQLLPLLAATQADIEHVAVLIDRTGADCYARTTLGDPVDTATVSGDEEHVHRGAPGGWSQRRFQQRAENTWEANAKQVVEELLADSNRPDVVVVGGDVRAVGFFTEHLPSGIELLEVDGSRSADHDAFLDHVDTAIRTLAASRLTDRIGEARDAIGGGRGAEGDAVLQMLSQGRVDRLYVANDTFDPDRPAGPFDFSVPISIEPDRLGDHTGETQRAPLTDGAVALAVATGAEVVVLPSTGVAGVDGPLAAILRG